MKKYLIIVFLFSSIYSFSQTNSIRDLAKEISTKNLKMSELVSFTNEKYTDSIDKAKFIYYWIGLNIKYDYVLLEKMSSSLNIKNEYLYNRYPTQVFIKKMAVCYGYSKLFEWFMTKFGIESKIITGFIRDERNHYVELNLDSKFGHAWNAIKLNGKWRLVDTTWGTSLNADIADFYFDMNPQRAIITHYPEDKKWQLLEKPLSLKEFNESKFVNPIWYKVGYVDIPSLKQDSNYYYLVHQKNKDKKWKTKILYSVDNKTFHPLKSDRILQKDLIIHRFYKSIIPKKTFFKINIHISLSELDSYLIYSDVINFKMQL